ncbi:hypothetical protein ACFQ5N_09855 [Lutibacter holmesii]|uniref:Uncharacterized protein n=1 Tax=Lutibacter holmesii TaxID=1137985 RepID=A0ABW3WPP6_9FLAO
MKDIALKSLVILPIIAFFDYLIMIVVGCVGSFLGFNSNFYECTFCTISKVVFAVSLLAFLFVITLDIISHVKRGKLLW